MDIIKPTCKHCDKPVDSVSLEDIGGGRVHLSASCHGETVTLVFDASTVQEHLDGGMCPFPNGRVFRRADAPPWAPF